MNKLPAELRIEIFSSPKLTIRDLANLAKVSKIFHATVTPFLYQEYEVAYPVNHKASAEKKARSFLTHARFVRTVKLIVLRPFLRVEMQDDGIKSLLKNFKRLTYLSLDTNGSLPWDLFLDTLRYALTNLPHLVDMSIAIGAPDPHFTFYESDLVMAKRNHKAKSAPLKGITISMRDWNLGNPLAANRIAKLFRVLNNTSGDIVSCSIFGLEQRRFDLGQPVDEFELVDFCPLVLPKLEELTTIYQPWSASLITLIHPTCPNLKFLSLIITRMFPTKVSKLIKAIAKFESLQRVSIGTPCPLKNKGFILTQFLMPLSDAAPNIRNFEMKSLSGTRQFCWSSKELKTVEV